MSENIKKRRVECDESSVPMDQAELLTGVKVVCRERFRVQAVGHVEKLIDEFAECCHGWTLPKAVKTGNIRLVARVMAFAGESATNNNDEKRREYRRAVEYAAVLGDVTMVQKLREWSSIQLSYTTLIAAALNGDLPLLRWMKEKAWIQPFNQNLCAEHVAFDVAAEQGCLDTVQWLVAAFPNTVWRLGPAALGGHLETIKWLHQHANVDFVHLHGRPSAVQRLTFHVGCSLFQECSANAKEIPKAVQWRFSDRAIPAPTDPMDWAARNGHLDVLKWLHANRSEGCSSAAVNDAAEAGNLEMLLWMNERYHEQWTVAAMDHAARGGKLEVVEWMHANRYEGCTTNAIDWAAESGHLQVIQWLHANRNDGCTTGAMILAAKNGHLDVVQWLHSNRDEGCTTGAMNLAAKNGHLDVVQWLHSNRDEGCTTEAMDLAAEEGHLEVVQWLHANRTEGCTTDAVDMAAGYGHLEVVKWLYANRTEGGTLQAINFADLGRYFEVLQWFEEQHIDLPFPADVLEAEQGP